MQAVQGLLNYAPNGPKDGGLMLMKGSSKLFDEFFSQERTEADHVSNFSNFFITLSRTILLAHYTRDSSRSRLSWYRDCYVRHRLGQN